MLDTFVSLDLETTGLSPDLDEIIEIGVVKFQGEKVLETFHTLVKPFAPLSHKTHLLTGITQKEVETAPPFWLVAEDLLSFVGNHPIVGQNITFDLDFLSSQGVRFSNPFYDTLELARLLLPQLLDNSLPALAKALGIPPAVHHRALSDAMTAKEVFLALVEKAFQLDLPLVAEINRLTQGTDWMFRSLFKEIEGAKLKTLPDSLGQSPFPLAQPSDLGEPLTPNTILKPLDLDQLTALLKPDGSVANSFPAYEYRPEQVSMMSAVAQSLNNSQHLIVEAGTGIGKSLAYLLPAIFFAVNNNAPVIISTNTINLQEQLMTKDIPDLLGAIRHQLNDFRVTRLKGRGNYLCPRRWNSWRNQGLTGDELKFLLRTLVWLSSTSDGDRAEINLVGNESSFWKKICAQEESCLGARCIYDQQESCFLRRARQRAERAHMVVINHALLLSDVAKGGRVLPNYSHLIVDEAHHLEEEATKQLGFQIGEQDIVDYLNYLSGLLSHIKNSLQGVGSERRKEIEQIMESLRQQAEKVRVSASSFFGTLLYFLQCHVEQPQEHELRLTREIRQKSGWSGVEISWENLSLELERVEGGLSQLYTMIESLSDMGILDFDHFITELSSLRQEARELSHEINSIVGGADKDTIYWLSLKGRDDSPYLCAAPLHVGPILEKYLFSKKDCVVLTSATLSTEGTLEYIKERLGLKGSKELLLGTPFDHLSSTLIYLPQDIPPPDKPGYQAAVEDSLIELCREVRGYTLVLFTSYASLQATYAAIQPYLEKEGIQTLGQGIDGSPKRLLDAFKSNPETILLGTSSLWEGIDVVGKALSVLVIIRLPFSVPTEPVFAARSELFKDAFDQYALPQAILRFKQGFGRLIRSKEDRGVIVVLDQRLQAKPYGKAFLSSLPTCTIKSGWRREMPKEVLGWLNLGRKGESWSSKTFW